MYPGFRYHVVTVAAIFLALGVGILIGSSFVQSAIVQQMGRKLDDLRAQYNREVVTSREDNRIYSGFVTAIRPMLVDSRLATMRIALVQTGDYPDTTRKIRETLEQAGATINSVTVIDSAFPTRLAASQEKVLPKLRAIHPTLPSDSSAVFRVIAAALAHGTAAADMDALSDARLIDRDGDYTKPNDIVVLVGGASEDNDIRADSVDAPLIAQLKSLNVSVGFAEPKAAGHSYIQALRGSDVTTVDNADTEIGRISLVLALRGGRGNYGVKPTASDLLPPSQPTDDLRRSSGL